MRLTARWPDVLALTAVPSSQAVEAAERDGQRIRLGTPVRFGVSPSADTRALRFLVTAAERYVPVEWRMLGELPWPLHTVVHLPPPTETDGPGTAVAQQWRRQFDLALCTYRFGPGFVLLRDNRPGKERFRAHLGAGWVRPFRELVAGTGEDTRLLGELVSAGLAMRLGGQPPVVLAAHLRRWPVPCFAG
ncbi:DUF5825 family protein [Kibdelosporangium phytohabitans]|uniref:Uncharacterized protein n=1 Tax=Kibdelosporangium phytohabitans TaxID=860235 RepID=A0A0N9I0X1_9PSEU|nr:DUF5825 family protein [Kibdelosporangium phytohabitans]ALG09466.1 hypothetical protein AOZ06_23425 [Kibdelosporangium phytohabitans]MBE1469245.1 hypothetical protein [Kibdelosporangium phytohabitans]